MQPRAKKGQILPLKQKTFNSNFYEVELNVGFPGGSSGKEPNCQCTRHKRHESVPGLGRSPGGRHSNPLQYSCLENPMDRGVWWATVHGVTKSQTRLNRLSMHLVCILSQMYVDTKNRTFCVNKILTFEGK